eukprot:tig00000157_g9708.t1
MAVDALRCLDEAFERDPDIDEMGVMLSSGLESNRDLGKSLLGVLALAARLGPQGDPPLVVENHKLGVAPWFIPVLYVQARKAFAEALPSLRERVRAGERPDQELARRLLSCTRGVLLVNADHGTAWNARKRALEAGAQAPAAELAFLDLLFTKHTKSAEAWAHRRWLLQRFFCGGGAGPPGAGGGVALSVETFRHEAEVCGRVGSLYPKNYHAWTHRGWALERAAVAEPAAAAGELAGTEAWAGRSPGDYSGWHYRQRALLLAPGCPACRLAAEVGFLEQVTEWYPAKESLWLHRRFLARRCAETGACGCGCGGGAGLLEGLVEGAAALGSDPEIAEAARCRALARAFCLWARRFLAFGPAGEAARRLAPDPGPGGAPAREPRHFELAQSPAR